MFVIFLIVCCIVISFLLLNFLLLNQISYWYVHKVMTNDMSTTTVTKSFKDFKIEFDKHKWIYDNSFSNSLFVDGEYEEHLKPKFHASIIKFDGVGMVMKTALDFYRAKRYVKKYIKTNFKKV